MEQGWITIHRKLKDKGYYKDSHYVHLWIHLLLSANHESKEFLWNNKIIKIDRGQLLTGRKKLSSDTGINESKIERILKVLKNEQQIEQQKTTKYRLITILNYNKFQSIEQQIEQQVNNKRTQTTIKQCNNKNKNVFSPKPVKRVEVNKQFLLMVNTYKEKFKQRIGGEVSPFEYGVIRKRFNDMQKIGYTSEQILKYLDGFFEENFYKKTNWSLRSYLSEGTLGNLKNNYGE